MKMPADLFDRELRSPVEVRISGVRSIYCALCTFAFSSLFSLNLLSSAPNQAASDKSQKTVGANTTAGDKAANLLSLRLLPDKATLGGAHGAQRFLVIGKYSDGMERDVTTTSRFSLTNPQVAQISGARVTAMANGTTTLKAELE